MFEQLKQQVEAMLKAKFPEAEITPESVEGMEVKIMEGGKGEVVFSYDKAKNKVGFEMTEEDGQPKIVLNDEIEALEVEPNQIEDKEPEGVAEGDNGEATPSKPEEETESKSSNYESEMKGFMSSMEEKMGAMDERLKACESKLSENANSQKSEDKGASETPKVEEPTENKKSDDNSEPEGGEENTKSETGESDEPVNEKSDEYQKNVELYGSTYAYRKMKGLI